MNIRPYRIVVLVSGFGSNLQAMIDTFAAKDEIIIAAVISNNAQAYALSRAQQAGIAYQAISYDQTVTRSAYDQTLITAIEQYQPDLVVLAGFMWLLTKTFVDHYQSRIINIHPSLLPKFSGLNTHQRALDAAESRHGVTVHYVTHKMDAGPIIAQMSCAVYANDTAERLEQRVHQLEHQLYPQVLRQMAKNWRSTQLT